MEQEVIYLREKMERSLVRISVKVADAVEMTQQAKTLSANSEVKLVQASLELEELYQMISEVPKEST